MELLVSDDIVVLRTFIGELEARLAATILEANGIPAQVLADTAGGAYPSMGLVFPARLLVRASDAALAAEILDTPADTPADEAMDAG
jgi:hypothetical protein